MYFSFPPFTPLFSLQKKTIFAQLLPRLGDFLTSKITVQPFGISSLNVVLLSKRGNQGIIHLTSKYMGVVVRAAHETPNGICTIL